MKRIAYKCKLLTDIVITSNAATEGFHRSLDYIPGAKFLGIVSSLYDEHNSKQTLDIFHNGNVRFGDAHPIIDGKRSQKVPLTWFYEKGEDLYDSIYLDHNLDKDYRKKLAENGIVLKQARAGYFSNTKWINPSQSFSIKSAYDSSKRKAKDQQMYGYFALSKGTEWMFYVDFVDASYGSLINSKLEGKHRVGRSRSAEYGLVEISQFEEISISKKTLRSGVNYIYAASNLCFYNQYMETTGKPESDQLNLPTDSKILWSKSKVRTRIYQTWNSHRFNRDADRLIIEKGSVFAVEVPENTNLVFSENLGSHRSEGFGDIVLNPDFLTENSEILSWSMVKNEDDENDEQKKKNLDLYIVKYGEKDSTILRVIHNRASSSNIEHAIDDLVNEFIKSKGNAFFGKPEVTSSQWGQVRNYAKFASNKTLRFLLFEKEVGFFNRGQTEHIWRKKGRKDILEIYLFGDEQDVIPRSINKREFVMILASEMAKKTASKK